MRDTPATGEAARGLDLDAIERAAREASTAHCARVWQEHGECVWPHCSCAHASKPEGRKSIKAADTFALIARIRSAEADRDAALARVKELEAGLEPFAEAAGFYFEGDEHLVVSGTNLSIGDLRTAARLLAGKDGADG